MKRHILIIALFVFLFGSAEKANAQLFWLGVNGGVQHNWFDSPKVDNVVLSSGAGWNLGFLLKYGQRPFYQIEFRWMRADNNVRYEYAPGEVIEGEVPFHQFSIPVKVGYTLVKTPMFKWHVNGGASIGSTFLFSENNFEFERDDMTNPQVAVIGGTGIQFMNFIFDIDYAYHLTDLFKGDEADLGLDFGSHLKVFAFKAGMLF